jgi:hypothetical protein
MLKALWWGCVFAGSLGSLTVTATAQQVVHALTGTVSSIDDLSKTLIVFQDNGQEGQFKDMTSAKTRVVIDKKIALDSTSGEANKKKGAYVIVFYYGDNEDRLPRPREQLRNLRASSTRLQCRTSQVRYRRSGLLRTRWLRDTWGSLTGSSFRRRRAITCAW